MRLVLAIFAVGLLSVTCCDAQVINGESTYEDNFEHVPPRATSDRPSAAPDADAHPAARSVSPRAAEPRTEHD